MARGTRPTPPFDVRHRVAVTHYNIRPAVDGSTN